MNKKRLIILSTVALALIALASVLISSLTQKTFSLSGPAADNFRYASLVGPNQAQFFNGSEFMEFNFSTQTAAALTPSYALPNVLDVRWSKDGALFKATGYSGGDQLRAILTKANAPTDAAYWWAVNFKTGAISPVGSLTDARDHGAVVGDVQWATDDKSYYYEQTPTFPDEDPVTTLWHATPGSIGSKLAEAPITDILWSDGNKLIYQTATGSTKRLSSINLKTLRSTIIKDGFEGTSHINNSSSRNIYIAASSAGFESFVEAAGPLADMDIASGKIHIVTKQFTGTIIWNKPGTDWVAVDSSKSGTLAGFIGDIKGKTKKAVFKYKGSGKLPENLRVVGNVDGRLLLLDTDNTAYLAGNKLPKLKKDVPTNVELPVFNGTGGLLDHGVSAGQVEGLKYAVKRYLGANNMRPTNVSIDPASIEKIYRDRNSASTADQVSFIVTFDSNTKLNAKLEYFDLSAVRLILSSPDNGSTLYDSGPIDVTIP